MKCQRLKTILLLGILTSMPNIVFSRSIADSLVLNRIFSYRRNFTPNDLNGHTTNVYVKTDYNVVRRNPTLWLIPSMYSIADGERKLIAESYNKITFKDITQYDVNRQVCFSTIRHNRRAMPTIVEFMTPSIYDICLYNDHILSPFNKHNRHFYHYSIIQHESDTAIVNFRPRLLKNTQLVSGTAVVSIGTGRVVSAIFNGEFDMIRFHTETTQGDSDNRSLLPQQCKTFMNFKFMGNKINASFEAVYDCPITLPDSINNVFDLQMMDSLRPIPLTEREKEIYKGYTEAHQPDTTVVVDTVEHFNFVKDVLQDAIGDNLISSIRYESENTYMKLSPILDPQYISYSSSRGFSYRLKFGAQFRFNNHRYFEFYPWCGYNFKYEKFYFTMPFYFHYNPKRNGYLSLTYGNGNRIGSGVVIDEIKREYGDTLNLDNRDLEYFDDNYLTLSNNLKIFDWIELTTGFAYHRRVAYNTDEMRKWKKPRNYYSFAPMFCVKLTPWRNGPVLSVDYERGIKGVLSSFIDYERWEFDASIKHRMKPMRLINARVGGGFYTRKKENYFVDYQHFRENKLPGGWDDDWSGDFQLLNSDWYNESRYYARANLSYESPWMVTSCLPLLGHYIEKERIYFSVLSIDNTRPYTELGYGFTTRLISIGLFASFLNAYYQGFGSKFTFELFRRW